MSELAYRFLNTKDAPCYKAFRLRALRDEPTAFLEDLDEAATLPESHFCERILRNHIAACFVQAGMVGMTTLAPLQGVRQKHKAMIGGVFVAAEARGRGVAKALLMMAIEKAQSLGLELLQLSTDTQNKVSQGLYRSLGFEPYGIEKHLIKLADGSYVDEVLMVKFLTPENPA